MVSQSRQLNFSRTVWITFHRRGITSSVSVTSSPIFDSRSDPQHVHDRGRRHHHPLARQMIGEGLAPRLATDELPRPRSLPGRRLLGREIVLGWRSAVKIVQGKLKLIEQALLALGPLNRKVRGGASRSSG